MDPFFEKISFRIACLLALFLPVFFFPYSMDIFRLPKEVALQVGAVGIALFVIAHWIWNQPGKENYRFPSLPHPAPLDKETRLLFFLVLAFNAHLLASAFYAREPVHGLRNFLCLFSMSILFFYILQFAGQGERQGVILRCALASAAFTAFYCHLQYFRLDPIFEPVFQGTGETPYFVTSGFVDNPNLVAGYLAGMVPLSFTLAWGQKERWRKIFYFSAGAVMLDAVFLTASLGAMLSLLGATAAGGVLIFLRPTAFGLSRKKITILFIVLAGAAGVALAINPAVSTKWRESLSGKSLSLETRKVELAAAWEMFRSAPILGQGLGSYRADFLFYKMKYYPEHPKGVPFEMAVQAHNEYVQLAAETGLVGALLAFSIIAMLLKRTLAGLLNAGETSGDPFITLGCFLGFLAVLLDAVPSFPFHIVPSALVFTLMAGAAWNSSR